MLYPRSKRFRSPATAARVSMRSTSPARGRRAEPSAQRRPVQQRAAGRAASPAATPRARGGAAPRARSPPSAPGPRTPGLPPPTLPTSPRPTPPSQRVGSHPQRTLHLQHLDRRIARVDMADVDARWPVRPTARALPAADGLVVGPRSTLYAPERVRCSSPLPLGRAPGSRRSPGASSTVSAMALRRLDVASRHGARIARVPRDSLSGAATRSALHAPIGRTSSEAGCERRTTLPRGSRRAGNSRCRAPREPCPRSRHGTRRPGCRPAPRSQIDVVHAVPSSQSVARRSVAATFASARACAARRTRSGPRAAARTAPRRSGPRRRKPSPRAPRPPAGREVAAPHLGVRTLAS